MARFIQVQSAEPVLEAKFVGYVGRPSTPQIAYESADRAPRPKRQMRSPLWARIIMPINIVWLLYVVLSALNGEWLFR